MVGQCGLWELYTVCVGFISTMAFLRFSSLNINGCRDAVKRSTLFEYVALKNASVVLLQETHTDDRNHIQWVHEWKGQAVLSHGSSLSAGVAVLLSAEFQGQLVNAVELLPGRMLRVDVDLHGLCFSFFNVYAPNTGSDRSAFFEKLHEALKDCPQERIIVLAGDFNCTLDHQLDRNHEEPHPPSADKLRSVVRFHDLVDVWREAFPTVRQYTWMKGQSNVISAARLDRFYVQRCNRGRFSQSCIFPFPLSDHHYISVAVSCTPVTHHRSYWHFNSRLAQDHLFVHSFTLFWEDWRERQSEFKSLSQWWDIGKVQIKVFCQQYTARNTSSLKSRVDFLEQEILKSSRGTVGDGAAEDLERNQLLLRNLMEERGRGALVRARYVQLNDMDAPTAFFFGLEKQSRERKALNCLKLLDGRVTSDEQEIRSSALSFYEKLYGAELCDQAAADSFLTGLPQLPERHKGDLEQRLSFAELTESVQAQSEGRSPGLDGLPAEFYKAFWHLIGEDLHSVFLECIDSGLLPLSCRRAVVTLLPKKGDLGALKNWRPVSLLGVDYKILSKALTNRLKKCLATVIHNDQSYCIPERSIFDNLFLIRDLLSYVKELNLNMGLISLDQEKAFDRVDHAFLFRTLEAFGFGPVFTSYIKLLYTDVHSLLKINGSLTRPFPVSRGIRQGCGLSGLLYNLAIEPLLVAFRERLSGLSVQRPVTGREVQVKLTAYADDVTIIIRSVSDVENVTECLERFQAATSARVNWSKSAALLLGQWRGQCPPRLPQQCSWNVEGFKVLGVHFGSDRYMCKNWDGLREKILGRLQRWRWILPQLSYRGRALVVNNLAASMLWHRVTVLDPPMDLITPVQKAFVNFFWDGHHWLPPGVLYLALAEGGQGLIQVAARIRAMRLQAAQKLLFSEESTPWIGLGLALLRRFSRMDFDKQLFLIPHHVTKQLAGFGFYASVLQAWGMFNVERDDDGHYGLDEPLFSNPYLLHQVHQSGTVGTAFSKAGVTCVRHLIDLGAGRWRTAELLAQRTGVRSERWITRLIGVFKASLTPSLKAFVDHVLAGGLTHVPFPELYVSPCVPEGESGAGQLLSMESLQRLPFSTAGKTALYRSCVGAIHFRELRGRCDSKWRARLSVPEGVRPSWRLLYKSPLPKRSGDLQWRILHCIVPTNDCVQV